LNSLAAIIHKNKRNAARNSEKVVHIWCKQSGWKVRSSMKDATFCDVQLTWLVLPSQHLHGGWSKCSWGMGNLCIALNQNLSRFLCVCVLMCTFRVYLCVHGCICTCVHS